MMTSLTVDDYTSGSRQINYFCMTELISVHNPRRERCHFLYLELFYNMQQYATAWNSRLQFTTFLFTTASVEITYMETVVNISLPVRSREEKAMRP